MDPPSVAGEQNLHRDRLVQGADRCPSVIRREFTPWSPAGVPASRHASPPVLFPRDCTSGTNSAITLRRAIDLDEKQYFRVAWKATAGMDGQQRRDNFRLSRKAGARQSG